MPDLLSGSPVSPLDTPPTVADTENGSFTFNLTTYGIDADSGTYADCGVAFLACTTGRAIIHYAARLGNDTAGQGTLLCPVVRTSATVGSGSLVVASSDDNAIQITTGSTANLLRAGTSLLVEGLTAGSTYNVRLEHRVGGGIGTIVRRHVIVAPAT